MTYIVDHYDLPTQRACRLMGQARSTHYYRSVKDPQTALRQRMREIAQARVRYGYRRVHVLLKREGWRVSRNRVYRLYADEQGGDGRQEQDQDRSLEESHGGPRIERVVLFEIRD